MSDQTPDLLTADDVVTYLAERPWLRKTALSCVLPALRADQRWLYRRADLDAWVRAQEASRRDASAEAGE